MFRSNDQLRSRERPATPGDDGSGRGGWRYVEVGGGGAATTQRTRFARITGRAGTEAPWSYSGVRVVRVGGAWEEPEDAEDLGWDLRNLAEALGDEYGGNPVADDAIVAYWPAGDGTYWFERSPYRGTYP